MRPALGVLLLSAVSCGKVPIVPVEAGFTLSDSAWFEEEETLFIFYEVSAEQGIGDPTVLEITYATDDERVPWTNVEDLPTVHTHLPIDCGVDARCGSTSLHVPIEPREVGVRLRYHRDGELALEADTIFNVVGTGPAHTNRSLIVYGVFDEVNQRIQWRGRHQLPTVRNEQAEALGLRREMSIADQRFGTADLASGRNLYGYGATCPGGFEETDLDTLVTIARAGFNAEDLPIEASAASVVCADATVTDATGTFTTGAIARKNPEVRPAFPLLRSPIREATPIRFFLQPCDDVISADHEAMQRQRLMMGEGYTYCIDDWQSDTFVDTLVEALTDAVEAARPEGDDMVLVIGLHRDEAEIAELVEEALAEIVPEERHRTSPRLAGALVFDSVTRGLKLTELEAATLWCPASLPGINDTVLSTSSLSCAVLPDNPDFELGPFTFGALPILPPRSQYLDFIDTYSINQAGSVTELTFRTPEFSATAEHFDIGTYGVATFLNGELISADEDDAFSLCLQNDSAFFVFSSDFMKSEIFAELIAKKCEEGDESDICAAAELGLLPIEFLPDWHTIFGEPQYDLGLLWDFPYLLRMEYEAVAAGSVSALGLSIPFGFGADVTQPLGTQVWTTQEFPLDELLGQCRRFCDHPTFDSAGVYHVTDPFDPTYATSCYLPRYPQPGDSGYPSDP